MNEHEAFESQITLRQLVIDDYDAIVALQLGCFPGMKPWARDQFASLLKHFALGQMCIEVDGRLIASSASLIVDNADYSEWHNWSEVSDAGYIRNHDPEGDTLYGIEIQVHPDMRGRKLARRLYNARKELCRDFNLARIVIGGRMPGYAPHQPTMTAREYVDAVSEKRLIDPVLTSQLANGFVLKQIVKDYMPSDEDSAGFATILEWSNLDYVPDPVRRRKSRVVQMVRLATVQWRMRAITEFDEFAQQIEFFVDTASDYRSDFVLFPELFTTQLLSLGKESHRPGEAARHLTRFNPEYFELMSGLATRYNINIIGGTQFLVDEDNELLNCAYLFRRDGTIARQDKIHITPSEYTWWGVTGGDTVAAIDTDCGPIGIAVCYDVQFPEQVRKLVEDGARILFVPYNTSERTGHIRVSTCAKARCIENHIYVVTSGVAGNLPMVENADIHYAQSAIYTPSDIGFARDGIAAETAPNEETILVHDVDVELLRRHRWKGTVRNWNDRRKDLFEVVWHSPPKR